MSEVMPTLATRLWQLARETPDAEAAVDENGRSTFRDLQADVQRWACAFLAHGIVPGDRVAMLAAPCRESLSCLLATIAVGAIWCGLDPRPREPELVHRIGDLEPKLVVSVARLGPREHAAEVQAVLERCRCTALLVSFGEAAAVGTPLAAFLAKGGGMPWLPPPGPAQRRACVIVYTSGSSGVPKGALLQEVGIVDFCQQQNRLWPLRSPRVLNFLPIGHVGSIVDLSLPTLLAGGCIVFQSKFDPLASLRLVESERISFWGSVPATFVLQLALPQFASVDLSHVELIAIEGAAIPPELAAALLPIAPIATNYGMTETTSAITAMAPKRSVSELTTNVGTPLAGAEVRLAEPDAGGIGEIEVRSPRNLLGYWRAPEATAVAFTADGFFRTGDLGAWLPDGRLRLAGRKKEMFKSGGYNVYPAEVEAALSSHADVVTAAVVPATHAVWGEVGVAFVVKADAADAEGLPASLEAHCRVRLADYKVPKRFVLVESLPLLPIGKVDRVALRGRAVATGS